MGVRSSVTAEVLMQANGEPCYSATWEAAARGAAKESHILWGCVCHRRPSAREDELRAGPGALPRVDHVRVEVIRARTGADTLLALHQQ